MQELEAINRLEKEIRQVITNSFSASDFPIYQHLNGRRLYLSEAMHEGLSGGPLIGALSVVYASGHFLSLDRVVRKNDQFKKQRRIIYYLDSTPGIIGSSLLMELLKLSDGDEFSKHKFVQEIDKRYFQMNKINISSGEINEALSRMFRKTMPQFFGIKGKHFIRRPFVLKMHELEIKNKYSKVSYETYKHQIDAHTYDLVKNLNKIVA